MLNGTHSTFSIQHSILNCMKVANISHEGFAAIQVDTGPLALTVIPELGGKISSLRDTRSGREWLWRHPRMAYRRVPHGSSYVAAADTGGWDECFPSVSACAYPALPWAGVPVQDHGELWSQTAATQIDVGDESVSLHTRWHGVMLPYQFERTIRLDAGSARLSIAYRLSSAADEPLAWIWSAHPLIAIEPGMELSLPPGARFHSGRRSGLPFPRSIPSAGGDVDLSRLPARDAGASIKLWSAPLTDEGWASLRAPDGALHMRWDVAEIPQVAVWLNLGAHAFDGGEPYYNMGLEPCIGAQDSLADAVHAYHLFEQLLPGGARAWRLEVELTP
ncbi:aldose 1-epimerase family protein [Oscillochloris sp. ZM17-4]|uniref:DUF5107 domain-containing protein n=1 Tax=Oscillochloris sp. ZM17-4 TaxID=2866714 RepID=UPI001C738C35|nr:DUF5107 domain-containing protein [Oscillochloris sp. ZM17-4]MBX0331402.1 aldose 1-epimerase family protein [Oscillochloris sp. ZM17-4]